MRETLSPKARATCPLPVWGCPPVSGEAKKAILLAEDEPLLREAVAMSLEAEGCGIIEATDGEDAFQKLSERSGAVDLLITDVKMPKMNGSELAKEAKEQGPQLMILFLSSHVGDGRLAANSYYMEKPFLPKDLIKKVDAIFTDGNAKEDSVLKPEEKRLVS